MGPPAVWLVLAPLAVYSSTTGYIFLYCSGFLGWLLFWSTFLATPIGIKQKTFPLVVGGRGGGRGRDGYNMFWGMLREVKKIMKKRTSAKPNNVTHIYLFFNIFITLKNYALKVQYTVFYKYIFYCNQLYYYKVEVKFAWQISYPPANGASLGSY